jgi:hypothetical protein
LHVRGASESNRVKTDSYGYFRVSVGAKNAGWEPENGFCGNVGALLRKAIPLTALSSDDPGIGTVQSPSFQRTT